MIKHLSLILGNQLFEAKEIPDIVKYPIFMCESDDLCTHVKYHQSKLIFFLSAMREYKDELIKQDYTCFYHALKLDSSQDFFVCLEEFCTEHQTECLHVIEIEDHFFEKKLVKFCESLKLKLTVYQSPMFLNSREDFSVYLAKSKKPFMKTFYEQQRRKRGVLMDGLKPLGGRFSFDEDNRKKTPKSIMFPSFEFSSSSKHLADVKQLVKQKFSDHIGGNAHLWFPVTRTEVNVFFKAFLRHRLDFFGDYEDAIDYRSDFLFHSGLSQFINVGLITPNTILKAVSDFLSSATVKINSVEGFVRQIMGWREFIRGIYHNYDEQQQTLNFFNHKAKLSKHWYEANTGIRPLDDAIKQVLRLGYTHHINRLMVIGNIMLMCQIHPQEVYRWFMEAFIDSADWVMGPNVFGMSQFSDGGIFATKPYLCGSNYIRKMSHYKMEPWCVQMDALYWRFILDHKEFFAKNFRMRMMVKRVEGFSSEKIQSIKDVSQSLIGRLQA